MKIFIFNGQGGCGKDTFQKYLIEEGKKDELDFRKTSMIDSIKSIARIMNYNEGKDMRDRQFLNRLKMLFAEYNDSPYQKLKDYIKMVERFGHKVLLVDAREPSDIERLKKDFNVTTVLIERGEPKHYGNIADDCVFNIDYDLTIENNGTLEELKEKAINFYNSYIKEKN